MPDNDTLEQSFYLLEDILSLAADAVIKAQMELDGDLGKAYLSSCELDSHRMLYSIPQVAVDFGFGLEVDQQTKKWALLPWRQNKNRKLLHSHSLRFDLAAVPDAPEPLTTATQQATATLPPFYLREPYFLLSARDENALCQKLTGALRAGQWTSAVPGEVSDLPAKVKKEAEKIDAVFALEKQAETGMVFFRYAGETNSYLIVRVTEKSKNDSVFKLSDGALPEVLIYSLDGDGTDQMSYTPLHDLALTVRSWLLGELASSAVQAPADILAKQALQELGLQFLQPFALGMRSGYVKCLEYLSGATVKLTADSTALLNQGAVSSTFYDLKNVNAELRYSVAYEDTGPAAVAPPQFNFSVRRTIDGQTIAADGDHLDENKLIESRVSIRASQENGRPQIDIELATPEFVLAGSARDAFLKLAANSFKEISGELANANVTQQQYTQFLSDESRRKGVVALLAYRGKTPKEEFLVIWPGDYAGATRDFVFTCKRKDDHLDEINPMMRLDDPITEIKVGTPANDLLGDDADLSKKQYQAFHNFFHAVRIWRARVDLST